MRHAFLLSLAGLLFNPVFHATAAERTHTHRQDVTFQFEYDYLVILPDDYSPEETLPLVLFLHGAGERGDDLELVKKHGPFQTMKSEGPRAILVAPQCPKDQWWTPEVLAGLLDQVERNYRVDSSRIYLTGLSMGGYGAWKLAAMQPERFAAVAPICGGGSPEDAAKLVGTPVWAFHGDKDTVVELEKGKAMIEALREAGGEPKFTVYEGVAHNSWTRTYNDPDFYTWMFAQRRKPD